MREEAEELRRIEREYDGRSGYAKDLARMPHASAFPRCKTCIPANSARSRR
jgi:hypothetical protein